MYNEKKLPAHARRKIAMLKQVAQREREAQDEIEAMIVTAYWFGGRR